MHAPQASASADDDRVVGPLEAAHGEHAGRDEHDPGDLPRRRRRAEEPGAHDEHEHRRRAARQRVDDAEVAALEPRASVMT